VADASAIEWTDATWNPVRGCSIVSKGCTNCYAMKVAHRFSGPGQAYEGLTRLTKGGPVWTGATLELHGEHLEQPLRWKRPRRIFVNSMSDLFHESLDFSFIDKVFGVMGACDDAGLGHTFQVLTKRPQRMLEYMRERGHAAFNIRRMASDVYPPPNVWLGVSVEDQAAADERIPLLLQTPAAVRWISAEPLLGAIDLWSAGMKLNGKLDVISGERAFLHWVVAGGESGPGARPMHPDWARALRDQCATAGVPFFFKQWGNWLGALQDGDPHHVPFIVNAQDQPLHTTKKAAGRLLDGRTHDEYPT